MKLLDKKDIEIEMDEHGNVFAALHEHPEGCLWWTKYKLSDLPNDLICLDDLERFGIKRINVSA